MSAPVRLTAYGAVLAVMLAGGWLLGDRTDLGAVEPAEEGHVIHLDPPTTDGDRDGHGGGHGDADGDAHAGDAGAAEAAVPGGLQIAEDGYTLDLPTTGYRPGAERIDFRILGPDGDPLTTYTEAHEKDLHLIVVRRDLTGFHHVHPSLDVATGVWSVRLDLQPGAWRVFADFVPEGVDGLTLGADLLVPGETGPVTLPRPTRTATAGDFIVTVTGDLVGGEHATLDFEVTRGGEPVTDLEPYLGASGHLVALREGDLAYLHVHPDGEPGDGATEPGPVIGFGAEVPSAGRYHLFLDFKVDGEVHTAQLALDAR